MIRIVLAMAFALAVFPVRAEMINVFAKEYWTVAAGTDDGGASMCSIYTETPDRYFSLKYSTQHDSFFMHIVKYSWNVPTGTKMVVMMEFDNMGPWAFNGLGHTNNKQTVEASFDNLDVGLFIEEMAISNTLNIAFGGDEPLWRFDMGGSAASVMKYLECVGKLRGSRKPTQPFENKPSQPFTPKPKVTQPFPSGGTNT